MTQNTAQNDVATHPVLNPTLLTALTIAFPTGWERLRVQNRGQRRRYSRCLGMDGPPEEYGQEFHLDCPFCGDQHGRMRVNHTYDPLHAPHRWYCFNESCHLKPELRQRLSDLLIQAWRGAKSAVSEGGLLLTLLSNAEHDAECTDSGVGVLMPDNYLPLDQLPHDHHARLYLESRGFDPDHLSLNWLVGYSVGSSRPSPGFRDRLVIPFFSCGTVSVPVLVGWQARSVFVSPNKCDADPHSKYLTMAGMPKSRLLYSSPAGILHSDRVVVTEGVTDAWRCGEDAVAVFGKMASARQVQLIIEAARGRQAIVIAFDSDAEREAQKLTAKLQSILSQRGLAVDVMRCHPPTGRKDFGECTAEEAQLALDAACRASPAVAPSIPRRERKRDVPRTRDELAARLIIHATGQSIVNSDGIEQQVAELGMLPLLTTLEEPLLPIICEMERTGLRVDNARLSAIVSQDKSIREYAEQVQRSVDPGAQRIHALLDPLGARTGRITAKRFAIQNLKRELRLCIVPDEGRSFICADFSQFDWRIAAATSRDTRLLNAFANPTFDIYRFAAACVLRSSEHEVSEQQRAEAKSHMMYFLFTLRSQPRHQDAAALWSRLREELPELMTWRERVVERSRREGRVRTEMGRVMALGANADLEEWANQALGRTIQGNASDVFKLALLRVRAALPPEVRLLLPHHDAILLDVPTEHVEEACRRVRDAMETAPPGCPIGFPVKVRHGQSWGECST